MNNKTKEGSNDTNLCCKHCPKTFKWKLNELYHEKFCKTKNHEQAAVVAEETSSNVQVGESETTTSGE